MHRGFLINALIDIDCPGNEKIDILDLFNELVIKGMLVMKPLKQQIKHDESPFVSPVLKSADRHRLAVTTAKDFANCSRTTSRFCANGK